MILLLATCSFAAPIWLPMLRLPTPPSPPAPTTAAPDFNTHVVPLFKKYCAGCHNAADKEGELVLDDIRRVLAGGANGAVLVPGKSDDSRLIKVLTGKAEPAMPPEDNEKPTAAEIAMLAAWINAGAKGPAGAAARSHRDRHAEDQAAWAPCREAIAAVAFAPDGKSLAVARFNTVEILSLPERSLVRALGSASRPGQRREFSRTTASRWWPPPASRACSAKCGCGMPADGQLVRTFQGHHDSLYAAVLSPDGKLLATSSYDQQIKLWNVADGTEAATLAGHNDAVFDLAFRPDGKLLASASGDRTVKLWDVASGERLDTFGQPLKEQYAVAFSPDGTRVAARRRRQPHSRLADQRRGQGKHQSDSVLALRPRRRGGQAGLFARTARRWSRPAKTARSRSGTPSRWSSGSSSSGKATGPAAWRSAPDGKSIAVGRLDGSLAFYDAADGQADSAAAAAQARAGLARHARRAKRCQTSRRHAHRQAPGRRSPA